MIENILFADDLDPKDVPNEITIKREELTKAVEADIPDGLWAYAMLELKDFIVTLVYEMQDEIDQFRPADDIDDEDDYDFDDDIVE